MITVPQNRNASRRDIVLSSGFIAGSLGIARAAEGAPSATSGEISRSHAAIHQEIHFPASPARVYEVLTVAAQFDKVVALSRAMNSDMKSRLGTNATRIDARPGGAFALFGGYITGFNLELAPAARLVQAWREASWPPGLYSIARFALADDEGGTRLAFDHTGFPDEDAEPLAEGWRADYWAPLAKVLR